MVVPPAQAIRPAVVTGSGERGQWTRLHGKVYSLDGTMLMLRTDTGFVLVDISKLSPHVGQSLRRGGAVTVYGYPREEGFEAAGYIEMGSVQPEPVRQRGSR
jgi:hypothetical protein